MSARAGAGRGGASEDHELEARVAAATDLLAGICASLPEVVEEPAWIGTRWRVRGRTFSHVLPIIDGAPASYARALGHAGPAVVVVFRAEGPERDALEALGHPYFTATWGRPIAGVALDGGTDPAELAELITESYCLLAPAKLVRLVDRPADDPDDPPR